jgi:hypothetical protein
MCEVLCKGAPQKFQDVVSTDVLMEYIIDLYHRTFAAITETVVSLQDDFPLQSMLFQVMLDHPQGFVVPATEAGAPHADLNDYLLSHFSEDTK